MTELRSCPFCGGEAVLRSNGNHQYYVRCWNLKCTVFPATIVMTTPERAISAWNRRDGKHGES